MFFTTQNVGTHSPGGILNEETEMEPIIVTDYDDEKRKKEKKMDPLEFADLSSLVCFF